ncbi:MAG TPA: hypothetical protein VKF60_03850 [Myxococcota bacterium]|nr:hypothetical protein [Myxococcota bacterium]
MSRLADVIASAWCEPGTVQAPGPLQWLLVALAGAVLAYALWQAVRHTTWPGESDETHIKRRILDEERPP